jgi:hypothetical protein
MLRKELIWRMIGCLCLRSLASSKLFELTATWAMFFFSYLKTTGLQWPKIWVATVLYSSPHVPGKNNFKS